MAGHRKHSNYKGAPLKHVAGHEIRLTPATGFIKIQGSVSYLPRHHRVKVVITGKKVANNLGPGFSVIESVEWDDSHDAAGMRAHLEGVMSRIAQGLRSKTFIEIDLQLAKCNVTGMDPSKFMETQCSGCVCWYCEISGG